MGWEENQKVCQKVSHGGGGRQNDKKNGRSVHFKVITISDEKIKASSTLLLSVFHI